tara:strand:+ start:255 stop:563 length:309 start_codon:yes stop_codon:yes gene_type:complete
MKKIASIVEETRNSGQIEYASDVNVFADFESTADLVGIDRESVLLTFLNKHMRGIASYIRGHKSQREDVRGRITDAIVYLCLLWGMIEEDNKDPNWESDSTR